MDRFRKNWPVSVAEIPRDSFPFWTRPGFRTVPYTAANSNPSNLKTFFQTCACTVASGALTIAQVIIDSVTGSTDNSDATFTAVLWGNSSGKTAQGFGAESAFSLAVSHKHHRVSHLYRRGYRITCAATLQ